MKEIFLYLHNLYQRRVLIKYLTVTNLKANNKNTVLGYFWWLLEPLLFVFIYVVVVVVIFKRGGPDFPVFLFAAMLPWRSFLASINTSMGSMLAHENIIKQIMFPKGVIPVAATFASYVNFIFGLVILLAMILFFKVDITLKYVIFPFIILIQILFTLGIAFMFSQLNIFFRDINKLSEHLFRAWFYLSPALYPITLVPERFQLIYKLVNPFAVLFTSYRDVLLYNRYPDWLMLAWVTGYSLVVFIVGFTLFIRSEKSFVKVM